MPVFVNKYEITDDAIEAEMKHHQLEDIDNIRDQAARSLVIKRLLLEDAANHNFIKKDQILHMNGHEIEDTIETLLDGMIKVPEADTEVCQRYYDQDPSRYMDKKMKSALPFFMVEQHIKLYLEEKAYHSAFTTYIDTLIDQNKVVGMTV
jgi:peptidyl-prolyl cis-trans isomerase C